MAPLEDFLARLAAAEGTDEAAVDQLAMEAMRLDDDARAIRHDFTLNI